MTAAKEKFTPTAVGKWPSDPVELELPSGAKVRARKPSLFVWLKTGQVPDDIRSTLQRIAEDGEATLEERFAAVEWMLCKCVVEPVLSLVPKEGCLCIDKLDDDDKTSLVLSLGISIG
jgi:hypothetical protein